MYSQEARGYSQLLSLSAAALYFFLTSTRARSAWRWYAFVLCAAGAAYTHYFGVLTPALLACFALAHRREYRIPARWWAGGLLLAAALYTPWLAGGAWQGISGGSRHLNPQGLESLSAKWFSLFASVNWFNNGKWSGMNNPTPVWLAGLGFLLFTLPAAYGARELAGRASQAEVDGGRRRSLILVNTLWLAPLVLIVLAGWLGIQYSVRYVAFLAAPYYMAVGKGLSEIQPRWLRNAWVLLLLIHSGIGLKALYFVPFKEDYRSAVDHVARARRPGDCGVFLPARKWGKDAQFWQVYARGSEPPRLVDPGAAASGGSGCGRVWLVWDHTWWLNRDPAPSRSAKQALEDSLRPVERVRYFGMEVVLYETGRAP